LSLSHHKVHILYYGGYVIITVCVYILYYGGYVRITICDTKHTVDRSYLRVSNALEMVGSR